MRRQPYSPSLPVESWATWKDAKSPAHPRIIAPNIRVGGLLPRCRSTLALIALALISGCTTYRPTPLTPARVCAATHRRPQRRCSIAAQEIDHPILRPIEFNYSDGLSPDEAAVLAVLVNPSLRAERDRRGTACAELLQAGLLPNPQFNYNADFPTGGITPGTVNAFGLGVNWDISELISHSAKVDAASLQPKAVYLDIAWKEWQIAEAAKTAVYQKVALAQQVAAAREIDSRLRDNLNVIRKATKKGLTTEIVLASAEAASDQAHTNLVELQRMAAAQRLALNRVLGLPAEIELVIQADTELPDRLTPPPVDELLLHFEHRRLDLVALRYGYLSQEATVRAEILNQFPKVNFGVTESRDNTGVYSTGFGISIALPIFDRNQGHIAEACATRKSLYDEYVNRVFKARSDIMKQLAEIHWIGEQIKVAQSVTPNLQKLVDTYRTAVDAGQGDALSYYTAWNSLIQKQIEILKLKQQLIEARISLELATGLYDVSGDNVRPEGPMNARHDLQPSAAVAATRRPPGRYAR